MTDSVETPIVVNPSPAADQLGSAGRDALILLSALPALIAVLGTHDLNKIVAFIESQAFAPALGVIVAGGTIAWRQIIARRRKANLTTVAEAAPNSVAVVKT